MSEKQAIFSKEQLKEKVNSKQAKKILANLYILGESAVFRELLQNASSACKIRAKKDKNYSLNDAEIIIEIFPAQKKITIKDNGIGMTPIEFLENYRDYGTGGNIKYDDIGGQFGIGSKAISTISEIYILKTLSAIPKIPKCNKNGEIVYYNNKPVMVTPPPIAVSKKRDEDEFSILKIDEEIDIGTTIEFVIPQQIMEEADLTFEKIFQIFINQGQYLPINTKITLYGASIITQTFGGKGIDSLLDQNITNKIHETIHISNDIYEFAADFVGGRNGARTKNQGHLSYHDYRRSEDKEYNLHLGEIKILLVGIPVENYQTDLSVIYNGILNIKSERVIDISPTRDGIKRNAKFKTLINDIIIRIQSELTPIFNKYTIQSFIDNLIEKYIWYSHDISLLKRERDKTTNEYKDFLQTVQQFDEIIASDYFQHFVKNYSITQIFKFNDDYEQMSDEIFKILNKMQTIVYASHFQQFFIQWDNIDVVTFLTKTISKPILKKGSYVDDFKNKIYSLLRKKYVKLSTTQLEIFFAPMNELSFYSNEHPYNIDIAISIYESDICNAKQFPLPEDFSTARIMIEQSKQKIDLPYCTTASMFLSLSKKQQQKYAYYTKKSTDYLRAKQEGYLIGQISEDQIPLMKQLGIKNVSDLNLSADLEFKNKEITLWDCRGSRQTIPLCSLPYTGTHDKIIALSKDDAIALSKLKSHLTGNILIFRLTSKKMHDWVIKNAPNVYLLNDYIKENTMNKPFNTNLGLINLKDHQKQIKQSISEEKIFISQISYPSLLKFIQKDVVFIHTNIYNELFLLKSIFTPNSINKHIDGNKKIIEFAEQAINNIPNQIKKYYDDIKEKYLSIDSQYSRDIHIILQYLVLQFHDKINEDFWKILQLIFQSYDNRSYDKIAIMASIYETLSMFLNNQNEAKK